MQVSLTPELEEWITRNLSDGRYESADHAVREGLRLLAERDSLLSEQTKALRRQVADGIEDAEAGRIVDGDLAMRRARARIDQVRHRVS